MQNEWRSTLESEMWQKQRMVWQEGGRWQMKLEAGKEMKSSESGANNRSEEKWSAVQCQHSPSTLFLSVRLPIVNSSERAVT